VNRKTFVRRPVGPLGKVDRGLRPGLVGLRHHRLDQRLPGFHRDLRAPASDVVPDRRVLQIGVAVLGDQPSQPGPGGRCGAACEAR
jgi:hypothetical protein